MNKSDSQTRSAGSEAALVAPCAECPFKVGSPFGYDIDAHEAFHGGENTPACHKIVGLDSIFVNAPMDPKAGTQCRGYEAWLDGRPGFQSPQLSEAASAE